MAESSVVPSSGMANARMVPHRYLELWSPAPMGRVPQCRRWGEVRLRDPAEPEAPVAAGLGVPERCAVAGQTNRMWDAANRRPLTRFESAERTEILAALRQSDGNRSKAASLLGIGRTTLYRKIHTLGIDDEALIS
jgi:hypothetical protein